jgi:uncharacterized membrane protein
MSDFTRVDWQALRAARQKCRKITREAERSGNGDLLHTAYQLGQFLSEALPDAWAAAEDRVPDCFEDGER